MDLSSLNLFLKYLRNPLRFFGKIGVGFHFLGLLAACWVAYRMFVNKVSLIDLNVLVTSVFLLWVMGFQFLFIGLVASLIVRTGDKRRVALAPFLLYRNEERHDG